jgi:hypothetical protein
MLLQIVPRGTIGLAASLAQGRLSRQRLRVARLRIVPRGTIVKIDTGVGGDLRRIPGRCARILSRA